MALCETVIVGAQKFYCPFKDCSALLINDVEEEEEEEAVRESECPYCHRLFCAQCSVPWHSEIGCAEFQKLNKNEREPEDIMLMKLAQNEKWQRCPNCRYYVEKKEGCMFMNCSLAIISATVSMDCLHDYIWRSTWKWIDLTKP
ncbi:hypothetical protein LWI28_015837 [Acer negundo]|uniref:RBR-type E3 ubiquitin transferase n=1 Tax=Acer negundo TaxID=4023 RepID=A0AAD5NZR3_ACENE|nr:hypothetical protein LWI28_015837 [Acer negundo]